MADKIAVSFSKGLLANLPATKTPGKIYITTDERALYMDVDAETRIRLGDFQSFANVAALNANTNPSMTALYYVEDINCLAKWDGSKYVQINRDTGATDVETTGDGNAVTSATYDAATRKITLSKGVTFALPSDITQAISDLDLANTYEQKGAATTAKGEVIGASGDEASADTIHGAKAYADNAATTAANGKDAAIAAAKKAGDDAQADIDAVKADYLKAADKTELEGKIDAKQDALGFEGTYDKDSNKVVTRAYLETEIAGLTGAVHFIGVKAELPATSDNGDIVIVGNKEYVYATSDNKWHELGDETIYAVKGDIKDADVHADAAIAQSKIAGLTDDIARIGVIEGKESGWDTAASKAVANETAIGNIKDGENIDSFGDVEAALEGKQDTIPANTYDAYGAASTAKNEVVGNASTDTSSDKTIEGTRKYAEELAADATISWGSF